MKKIRLSEVTIGGSGNEKPLTFRRRIEICKLLDRIGVDTIETGILAGTRQDCILVKTLSSTAACATLSVGIDVCAPDGTESLWEALATAHSPRLQAVAPVSTVQMEYLCHRKPASLLEAVGSAVARCAALCPDVEFVAKDFTRSDTDFLSQCIRTAVEAGATRICLYDEAGDLLPDEFHDAVRAVRETLPDGVALGVRCSNAMYLADACALSAVKAGADEIKTSASDNSTTSLKRFAGIIDAKGALYGVCTSVRMTDLQLSLSHIRRMTDGNAAGSLAGLPQTDNYVIKAGESREKIAGDIESLGYHIGEDDLDRVYDAFLRVAAKNGEIQLRELDAIVASEAFQAPKTYTLESYVVNSSNMMSSTCHLRIRKDDAVLEGVCCGDGPVDAAFHAIEQLVGGQYELDDFQIRSVTEGRESLGEAIVKLRGDGRMFSGRGISSDIVGSSILAYINAVNKIVFEEEEASAE